MSVTITLSIDVKPEKLIELKGFFKENLPDARAYEGCQFVDVFENQDKPSHLLLYQHWDSKAHYEKYVAWRNETGTMDSFAEYLAGKPIFSYYDKVDV